MWKKWIVVLVVVVGSLLVGCELPEEKGYYQKLTEVVVVSGEKQIEVLREVIAVVKESGLADEKKMGEIEEKIEKYGEKFDIGKEVLLASAKKYDEMREEDKTLAIIEAAMAGNTASAPINPYASIIGGVLAIVYALKKKKEASENGSAVKEIVRGVEKFMSVDDLKGAAKELRNELSITTSDKTKAIVNKAKL
jgi:hypothetical protein